jgi:hypothetical protein
MGPPAYFPSEGRRAGDFFALKNPTSSAGFEPANLGNRRQHASFKPATPLKWGVTKIRFQIFTGFIWIKMETVIYPPLE